MFYQSSTLSLLWVYMCNFTIEEYLLIQSIGANKLHTLIIVIGGNYTYIKKKIIIYKYNVSCQVQSLKKFN